MLRKTLFASTLVVSAMFAGAAWADAPYFVGNTIKTEGADGVTTVKYNADGTATATLPDGSTSSGTWRVDGTTYCDKAADEAAEICREFDPSKKVGDTFDSTDRKGNPIKVTVVAGQ